jgi:hypothetical protein
MYDFAARMDEMVRGLNAGSLKGVGTISCLTCHRGGANRALQPPRLSQGLIDAALARWPTSLNLDRQNANTPAARVYKNLQVLGAGSADDVKWTMVSFSASLGVSCDFCHTPPVWSADNVPAKHRARTMLVMMREFSRYFDFATAAAFRHLSSRCGQTTPIGAHVAAVPNTRRDLPFCFKDSLPRFSDFHRQSPIFSSVVGFLLREAMLNRVLSANSQCFWVGLTECRRRCPRRARIVAHRHFDKHWQLGRSNPPRCPN